MEDRINIGDKVTVCWDRDRFLSNLEVLDSPSVDYNRWIFKAEDGRIVYVQQYESIMKEDSGDRNYIPPF